MVYEPSYLRRRAARGAAMIDALTLARINDAETRERIVAEDYDNARRQLLDAARNLFPAMRRPLAIEEATATGSAVMQIADLLGGTRP